MIHIRRLTVQGFKQLQEVELAFPRRGRVLIQGANESGKSTLFEAVYFGLFGRPLVTETSHQRLDDVIRYGAEAAWVALELDLPAERRLTVTRHVRRGRPNQWELEVHEADGRVELVRSNTAVNERIEAELRFDGEALLNTCFVEQKKLEKLEGLSRRDREQSLMKLLNLDQLLALENDLKVRAEDRAQVARLADRARLAQLRAELPALEARLADVTQAMGRHEVHAGLAAALAAMAALAQQAEALAAARARSDALAERAAAAEAYRAGLANLREARTAWDRAREGQQAAAGLAVELAAAQRARDEAVPAVVRQGKALGRLGRRLALVESVTREREEGTRAVAEADARLARAAEEREALNSVRRSLVEARAVARDAGSEAERLAGDLRAFEVRETLAAWVTARVAEGAAEGPDERLAAARDALAATTHRDRLLLGGAGLMGLALLLLWRLALPATFPAAWWLALILYLSGMAVAGLQVSRRERRLAEAVGRREGEAAMRGREAAVLAEQVAVAERRLVALNVVRPANEERARRAVAELDERLAGRERDGVAAELDRVRRAAAQAEAEVQALTAREAELRASAGRFDAAALGRERDALAARLVRQEAFLARRQPWLGTQAAELGVTLTAVAVEGELGVLRGELKALRAEAERVPALAAALRDQGETAAAHQRTAEALWAELPAAPGLPAWSAAATSDETWSRAQSALSAAYEAAGGEAVAREAEAAAREASRLAGAHEGAARALDERLSALREQMAERAPDVAWPQEPDRANLTAVLAVVAAGLTGDPDSLAAEQRTLTAELNVARHDILRLEQALGLAGETLDAGAEAAAWSRAERELAVRERAAEVVGQAGRSVVQRVLPSTLEHMRRLLPTLTDGRYFDAELTDDYRIRVLDERAGGWKQKNIFSGGTKDQLSLALRLAFALATLPEERGAAPSFLFLDEPLGAFDEQRAQALVALLTAGEIADSFDQVFLISHVRVDETLFDHQVTLAEGRVAASTLPEPPAKAQACVGGSGGAAAQAGLIIDEA